MAERLLAALLQQALWMSVSVVLLAGLRPLLLRRLGAGLTYASWLLLPALLLVPALPRPAQEPLPLVLQAAVGAAAPAGLPALPAPPASQTPIWLALWLAGTALTGAVQTHRQWRLARWGERLPSGFSPALVGLLRPRVVLPMDFEQRFVPEQRELILAHEQVHRDRRDNLWNLLACALAALHWWNPLAWWAWRRLQADQELACDAAVLATRPGSQTLYTQALLAAHGLTTHGAPLASRWTSSHPLIERIAMLKHPRPLNRRQASALLAAGLSACSLAYAVEAESPQAPRYVEIRLQLDIEGQPTMKPLMISELGAASSLSFDQAGEPLSAWKLKMTVTQGSDGHLVATTEAGAGIPARPVGGLHRQLDAEQPLQLTLRRGDGGPALQMQRQIRLLPTDFKPPR